MVEWGKKREKKELGVFSRCSQTDTAFCVQEGNLERAMPIRHRDMQGKLGNIISLASKASVSTN